MDDKAYPQGEIGATISDSGQNLNSGLNKQSADGGKIIYLTDYLAVISRHRKMIFRLCAITVVATAIVSLFLPKSFSATTTVVPPADVLQRDSMLSGGLGAARSPLLRQVMDFSGIADMYVGILQSRSVADALIERFNLAKVYNIKKGMTKVRRILSDRTSIKVTEEGIVNITVEDRDRERAANLANAYVEELDRQNKRLFVGQAASKKAFLENRLKEIEKDLSGIDNLLSRDAKIKEMLFELLTKEFEIAKIEEAKSMPTIQVLDKAVVPENKCKPARTKIVLISGILAFFAAMAIAFSQDHFAKIRSGNTIDT
jgi:tyrosine-protein kinase Etk/Wzc